MGMVQSPVRAVKTYLVGTHREIEDYFGEKRSRGTLYTNILLVSAVSAISLFVFWAGYSHSSAVLALANVLAMDLFLRWPIVIDDTFHTSGFYSLMNGRMPVIETGFTRLGGDGIIGKCRRIHSSVRSR